MLQVYCVNTKEYIDLKGGETLEELSKSIPLDFTPICAKVNNKTEHLKFQIFAPKQIEFLPIKSTEGMKVCVRSLCMMLYKSVNINHPDLTLRIEHSICNGYFCRLLKPTDSNQTMRPIEITDRVLENLKSTMQTLVKKKLTFDRYEILTEDVIQIFKQQGLEEKVQLLETTRNLYSSFYKLDGLADSYYAPLAPNTSYCRVFNLVKYENGFLLMPPDPENPAQPRTPSNQPKMYKAFVDYLKFNRIIKVSNVGELNRAVLNRETSGLINVAEAMHDKLLGRISDEISERRKKGGAQIIMLAGPSSSGKTTTCKRLAIQLMTNLITPKMISLDDYFVNREDTPKDETGEYDYESLYALDLERLNSDLTRLLNGETINLPTYSFELGRRVEKERPLSLKKNEVLLMEGIHGLNPALTPMVDSKKIFKIYVSALTTLCIDNHNWISTTDNRLLRRIVRDHKYRHTSAFETIKRWPSVRRGEQKWIFPYSENADATFNSSLLFEIGVMKAYAEPLLHDVPHNAAEYSEAYRLMKFLSFFETIPADQIPTTSLLREFLGGSSFHY